MNNETCYLVVYDDLPGLYEHTERIGYTTVERIYRNSNKAVELVREYADHVKDARDSNPDRITIIYDGPFENWLWLFTWEENTRQYTYKVVPHTYDD